MLFCWHFHFGYRRISRSAVRTNRNGIFHAYLADVLLKIGTRSGIVSGSCVLEAGLLAKTRVVSGGHFDRLLMIPYGSFALHTVHIPPGLAAKQGLSRGGPFSRSVPRARVLSPAYIALMRASVPSAGPAPRLCNCKRVSRARIEVPAAHLTWTVQRRRRLE